MSLSQVQKIRIASTLAGLPLGWLQPGWDLPFPTTPIYNPYVARISKADGGISKRGWISSRLTWVEPTITQAATLYEIAEFGDVYATLNRGWAAVAIDDWIDVSGKVFIDNDVAPIAGANGIVLNAITLVINNITIVNDPASF